MTEIKGKIPGKDYIKRSDKPESEIKADDPSPDPAPQTRQDSPQEMANTGLNALKQGGRKEDSLSPVQKLKAKFYRGIKNLESGQSDDSKN